MSKPRGSLQPNPEKEQDPDKTQYNCAICIRPDDDETEMILCDRCQGWYHFSCVGATATVKDNDVWICPECQVAHGGSIETDPDQEDEEIAAAMKGLELKRERLKKRQEQKLKLAQMQLDLDREKLEMQWATEKHILEMKIKTEADFNKKRKAEREKLQRELEQLTKESDSELEADKETRKKDKAGPTKAQLSARQFLSHNLPTFSGRPEEWPMFFSSYQTSTEACGFSNLENLARLQKCLKGAARDMVGSRLLLPDAVPQVMETLRMLYGRPEQLLDMLLLKVRKADSPKSDKLTTFITFGVLVQQLCDHLEATNLEDHLVNPMLIRELVDKLPGSTKIDWVRYKRQTAKVTLRTLADFLSDLVSAACEVVNYVDMSSQATGGTPGKVRYNESREQGSYVHAYGDSNDDDEVETWRYGRTPCVMCGQVNHRLWNCENFHKLSVSERWETVEEWELCPICLNSHDEAQCKVNIRCSVEDCSERHNSLLHSNETESSCNTHSDDSKESILFRMVPVRIFNGDRSVSTVAFLDEGSSFSLVDSSLARKLGCNGVTQPLRIKWTAGVSRLEKDSQRLQLAIAGSDSHEKFVLRDVHTVHNLKLPTQSLKFADAAGKYQHLKGLPVTDYAPSRPMLLIGLKHIELFAPLESRIGRPGEPIAVRSKLGWTVFGPQGSHEVCSDKREVSMEVLLQSEKQRVKESFENETDSLRKVLRCTTNLKKQEETVKQQVMKELKSAEVKCGISSKGERKSEQDDTEYRDKLQRCVYEQKDEVEDESTSSLPNGRGLGATGLSNEGCDDGSSRGWWYRSSDVVNLAPMQDLHQCYGAGLLRHHWQHCRTTQALPSGERENRQRETSSTVEWEEKSKSKQTKRALNKRSC